MDYLINLVNFCNEIDLNNESAMFFVYEGIITVKKQESGFYIDDKNAGSFKYKYKFVDALGFVYGIEYRSDFILII